MKTKSILVVVVFLLSALTVYLAMNGNDWAKAICAIVGIVLWALFITVGWLDSVRTLVSFFRD